ncbi:hypothetical protein Adt_03660 [Abeliophyllum distichum]|uniref:Uncharacterized protein n=1 Tax=Abeliophyllum distichum TaxID=126358 RepID=A0ABD1VZ46_9LAMI
MASANKSLPNNGKLLPQLGLSFCKRVILTQEQSPISTSSYIGRASSTPYKGQASSSGHGTSWVKSNIKPRIKLKVPRHSYTRASPLHLRHGTSWAKPNIKHCLILEGHLQTS